MEGDSECLTSWLSVAGSPEYGAGRLPPEYVNRPGRIVSGKQHPSMPARPICLQSGAEREDARFPHSIKVPRSVVATSKSPSRDLYHRRVDSPEGKVCILADELRCSRIVPAEDMLCSAMLIIISFLRSMIRR